MRKKNWKIKTIITSGASIFAIITGILTTYEFFFKVPQITAQVNFIQQIVEKSTGNGEIISTKSFTRSGDLRICIDPTPGIKAEIIHYPLGEYYLTGNYKFRWIFDILKNEIQKFMINNHRGQKVDIEVTGYADGYPIKDLRYRGEFGTIQQIKVNDSDRGEYILNLKPYQRIENHHLAFLRAFDSCYYLKSIGLITNVYDIPFKTHTTDQKGGEFRKVLIKIIIRGAVQNEYERLTTSTKFIFDTYNYFTELAYTMKI